MAIDINRNLTAEQWRELQALQDIPLLMTEGAQSEIVAALQRLIAANVPNYNCPMCMSRRIERSLPWAIQFFTRSILQEDGHFALNAWNASLAKELVRLDIEKRPRFHAADQEQFAADCSTNECDPEHVSHLDEANLSWPGICVQLTAPPEGDDSLGECILIDGNHRLRRCTEMGRVFQFFVLTPVEAARCRLYIGRDKQACATAVMDYCESIRNRYNTCRGNKTLLQLDSEVRSV